MSYQVLARKWRPKTFQELAGQEHVLRALVNALDNDRLHHAYLFTGTRGVGKTTIARILARCLNCEQGVSATPCGTCNACVQISEGRFVDLIEVDAASRTKVEDTRELLENVQYAPTSGRYKIYLIDEVHMLSTHSFNALLKTLEEPPPHVKFLLATTDPQKLPATILSRCLQFNLKNMTAEQVAAYLRTVLAAEQIPHDDASLWLLGRAANGSMRDALSLTDQAISFGQGTLTENEVRSMLGTIDQDCAYRLVEALAAEAPADLFAVVEDIAGFSPDFSGALEELLALLHRLAIAQALPEAVSNQFGDRARLLALAGQIPPEDLQLYYQLGLTGRRDLPLAPDPRMGFEMLMLRMLAFRPAGVPELPARQLATETKSAVRSADPIDAGEASAPEKKPEPTPGPESLTPGPVAAEPVPAPVDSGITPATGQTLAGPLSESVPAAAGTGLRLNALTPERWSVQLPDLAIGGVVGNLLSHCLLVASDGNQLAFQLDAANASLYTPDYQRRIEELLTARFGEPVKVRIDVVSVSAETPARQRQRAQAERQQQAEASLLGDPVVQTLLNEFQGQLDPASIRPLDS